MQIYKARIKKPQYNIYTVHSDIESANVYFDNEIVGSIIDGVCYIRVDKKVDTLKHTVKLQGGSVPKTVVVYTFTGTTITVSANADSALEMNPTASYKNTTVYNYNSNSYDLNFADGAEVTINSTPKTTKTELTWTPTTYNLQENFTKEAKQFKVTLTQTESNNTCVITINQAAGVEYTYTVNSDIKGATVLANGENVGTIENGKCVFTKWNTHAAESYTIEFEGGTLVPKANEYHLSNSVVPAVSELGDTLDLSDYIKSTVRAYSPYSPTGDVTKNGSVTLNTKYNYRDSSAGYNIDGDLVFDENQTTNKVTRTFTVTQTASGKQIEITVTQNAGVKYTYTVKSNIEGATVKFGTETVGTIKDGQLVVTKWNNHAAASYSVSFTGGTLVPKETEYTFSIKDIPIQSAEAGSVNLSSYITSSKKVYTPQRPTGTVSRNNSITLNTTYTSATSNVTYSPTTITVTENQTTKPVDYNKTITQDESGKTVTAEFQQSAGVRYSYTVNSDVEGAKVSFSGISDTGTITDGKYVLIRWNSHAAASYTVSLSGGTMPKKAAEYSLKNTLSSTSVPAEGKSYSQFIEETTITYTSVMPKNASCNRNNSVTMNTTYQSENLGTIAGQFSVLENQTTKEKSFEYTYTHSKDSNTKITIRFNQAAGIAYTYTVNSNIEGSKLTYTNFATGANIGTGTISNGKHILTLWNSHAPSRAGVKLSGGTLSEPEDYEYEFNITKIGTDNTSTDNAISVAGAGQSNMATTATSRKRRYEYHVPTTTFTVNRNGSVTANETKSYSNYATVSYSVSAKSQTWITNSGTNITVAKNPNDTARTGTITFTQAESNKTDIITVNQARGTYTYTINSNCNGGTVYFGTSNSSQTINVGTISNGKCVFERTEASGYVRISGGLPSNTSSTIDTGTQSGRETTTDDRTGTEGNVEFSSKTGVSGTDSEEKTINHAYTADSDTVDIICTERDWTQTRTGSRTRYRDYTTTRYYTYSNASAKSINGDSSITINYVENHEDKTSYGDWYSNEDWSWGNYGDAMYGSYRRGDCNNIGFSYDGDGNFTASATRGNTIGSGSTAGYRFTVRTTENTGGAGRAWGDFGDGRNWCRVMINKAAKPDNYVFYLTANGGTTANWDFPSGESGAEWTFRVESTKNGSYQNFKNTRNTVSWISVSYEDQSSASIIVRLRCTSANTGAAGRGGTLDFTQDGSGKKISINMNQPVADKSALYFYSNNSSGLTLSWIPASTVGTKNSFCTVISKDKNGNNIKPTAYVKAGDASVTVGNISNGRYPINVTIKDAYVGNQSYDIVIQNSAGKTATLNINRY